MTVNEAIEQLENLVDCFNEYPNWNVLSCNDLEAMEILSKFAKEQLNIE